MAGTVKESAVWRAACAAVRAQRAGVIGRRPGTGNGAECGPAPLTLTQASYWPGIADPEAALASVDYRVPIRRRFDPGNLAAALAAVLRHHHVLRSTFIEEGGVPMQVVGPGPEPQDALPMVDLTGAKSAQRLAGLTEEIASARFNLLRGPVYRAVLARSASQSVLLMAFPHMVWDAWSWPILTRDLRQGYGALAAGAAEPLTEPPIQLGDLAHWQHAGSYRAVAEPQLAYWTAQLRGLAAAPRLGKGKAVASAPSCPVCWFAMPRGVIAALRTLRSTTGASLFMGALACLKILIWRCTGVADVAVLAPMAGRNRPETRRLIGPLYNFCLLRTSLEGGPSFQEVLERVGVTLEGALANQDVSYGEVLEALDLQDRAAALQVRVQADWRTISTTPSSLGEATFDEQERPQREGNERTPAGALLELDMPKSLDLLWQFLETRDDLFLRIAHRRETVPARDVGQLVDRYKDTVLAALRAPGHRLTAPTAT